MLMVMLLGRRVRLMVTIAHVEFKKGGKSYYQLQAYHCVVQGPKSIVSITVNDRGWCNRICIYTILFIGLTKDNNDQHRRRNK